MWLSAISFVVIAIVLKIYDGNTSPELPYDLTLNAIISVLATICKACLIPVVAAAIGQLKWCWFQAKSRKLQDLQSFDDASRGPLGSASLLLVPRKWSIASAGAFITVIAVLFDPFVQQALRFSVH